MADLTRTINPSLGPAPVVERRLGFWCASFSDGIKRQHILEAVGYR